MRDDRNRYSDNRGGGYGRRDDRSSYGDREDRQMFPAVCDNCGKDCEVPFKPNGSKPIYCSDCFRKMGDNDNRGDRTDRYDRFESKEFNDRPKFEKRDFPRVESKPTTSSTNFNQQFDHLNTKLNKILALLEGKNLSEKEVNQIQSEVTEVTEEMPKEVKPKKKAVKKAKKTEEEVVTE